MQRCIKVNFDDVVTAWLKIFRDHAQGPSSALRCTRGRLTSLMTLTDQTMKTHGMNACIQETAEFCTNSFTLYRMSVKKLFISRQMTLYWHVWSNPSTCFERHDLILTAWQTKSLDIEQLIKLLNITVNDITMSQGVVSASQQVQNIKNAIKIKTSKILNSISAQSSLNILYHPLLTQRIHWRLRHGGKRSPGIDWIVQK